MTSSNSSLRRGLQIGGFLTTLFLTTAGWVVYGSIFQETTAPPSVALKFAKTSDPLEIATKRLRHNEHAVHQSIFNGSATGTFVIGGILEDGALISTEALNFITSLSCQYNTAAHVLVKRNPDILKALVEVVAPTGATCASVYVQEQPDWITEQQSRVDRLKMARDFQRSEIEAIVSGSDLHTSVIVLADLDLVELPLPEILMQNALHISQRNDVDVLCAAGTVKNFEDEEEGYYDSFATVLLPDTFVYPLKGRLSPEVRLGEDESLILGPKFRPDDLMQWFQNQGSRVPVKSCFGGLAMYRASKLLDQSCSYGMPISPEVKQYANVKDQNPCEHVVLHTCMQEADPSTVIAVQTDLKTRWHKSEANGYRAHSESLAITKVPSLQRVHQNRMAVSQKTTIEPPQGKNLRGSTSQDPPATPRPKAVIHVGPRKTGSTAIQTSIRKFWSEFEQDRYMTLAEHVHWFSHCLVSKKIDKAWDEKCQETAELESIVANITMAREQNMNIIVSSESLDRVTKVDTDKIKHLFHGFDIQVVVAYRRYFEWTVSNFGQMYRHVDNIGWEDWENLPPPEDRSVVDYHTPTRISDLWQHFYTPKVVEMYQTAGLPTHILNYHADEDVVSSFFCLPVVNAQSACEAVRSDTDEAPNTNRGVSIVYDRIAITAMEAGWIDKTRISRPDAGVTIRRILEEDLGLVESDLPHQCIAEESQRLLLAYSIQAEESLLPDFYKTSSGSHDLHRRFEQFKTSNFCSVDTKKVLLMPGFIDLLQK